MAKNRLIKNISRTWLPGSPGVPAHPGQPYIPGHQGWVSREVCTNRPNWGAMIAAGWTRISGSGTWVPPPGWTRSVHIPWVYSCRTERYLETIPAQPYIPPTAEVPATPSQVIEDFNLGWTGRAHSIPVAEEAARVKFSVTPGTVGAAVGLSFMRDMPSGFTDILHGFYVESGNYWVLEANVSVAGPAPMPAVFRIDRERGAIRYYADDVLVFESFTGRAGRMYLVGVLYAGGDEVFDPKIEVLEVTRITAPLSGYAYGTDSDMVWVTAPLSGYAIGEAGNSCLLSAPLTGYAWGADFETAIIRAPLTGYAQGSDGNDFTPAFCLLTATLLAGYAWGESVEVGFASLTAPALAGFAWGGDTEDVCMLSAPVPPVFVWGYLQTLESMMESGMQGISQVQGASYSVMATEFSVIWVSGLQAASVVSWQIEIPVTWVSQLSAESVQELRATIEAILIDRLRIASSGETRTGEPPGEVWVLNTSTGGSTRYEDYHFNSFAKLGDAYYGCRADGLYRLDGGTDDGAPVRAMVSFGKQDFGTTALKSTPYAYIGMSASGRMFLKVRVNDDQEYLYAARQTTEHLETQRVDMGRGIRASFVEFELWNEDGADFEVASVEFVAVPLSRRI